MIIIRMNKINFYNIMKLLEMKIKIQIFIIIRLMIKIFFNMILNQYIYLINFHLLIKSLYRNKMKIQKLVK